MRDRILLVMVPRPPTLPAPPPGRPIPLSPPVSPLHFLPTLPLLFRGSHASSTCTTPPAPPLALLYPAPSPARVTKLRNIECAYARSLRPAVSTLWRQRTLHPSPAAPPTTRREAYLRLYNVDVHRQNLYRPALYLPSPHTRFHPPLTSAMPRQRPPYPPIPLPDHPPARPLPTSPLPSLPSQHPC